MNFIHYCQLICSVIRYRQLISSALSVITNAAEIKMKNFDAQSNRSRNLGAQLLLSGEKEQSEV